MLSVTRTFGKWPNTCDSMQLYRLYIEKVNSYIFRFELPRRQATVTRPVEVWLNFWEGQSSAQDRRAAPFACLWKLGSQWAWPVDRGCLRFLGTLTHVWYTKGFLHVWRFLKFVFPTEFMGSMTVIFAISQQKMEIHYVHRILNAWKNW
jgi:hypothetical protein